MSAVRSEVECGDTHAESLLLVTHGDSERPASAPSGLTGCHVIILCGSY